MMMTVINAYGVPLLPGLCRSGARSAKADKKGERAFPTLYRLYSRLDGRAHREDGSPVEWIGADPKAASERLLHNRDPRHFVVRADSPRPPEV